MTLGKTDRIQNSGKFSQNSYNQNVFLLLTFYRLTKKVLSFVSEMYWEYDAEKIALFFYLEWSQYTAVKTAK